MPNKDNLTILVVAAHPSDPIANVGGTVAKHVARGDTVVFLAVTDGVEVHTEGLLGKSEQEIRELQREQSSKAARILGVEDYRYLASRDSPLVLTRDNLIALGDVIQEVRPDILVSAHYLTRQDEPSSDHAEAARILERAPTRRRHSGREPFSPKATWVRSSDYAFGDDRPGGAAPHVIVDITDTVDQKIEACRTTWAFADLGDRLR